MSAPKFSFNAGATTAAPATTGLFGSSLTSTPAASSTQPSLFGNTAGATGFGAASAVKPVTSAFGSTFGAGFGAANAAQPATAASPFGLQAKPAGVSLSFGGGAATAQPAAMNLFGAAQQAKPTIIPSMFSLNKPAIAAQPGTHLGMPQQQQNQTLNLAGNTLNQTGNVSQAAAPSLNDVDTLSNALSNPSVYNDERDLILAKWNQLQAFYGHGKVFYQNRAIDITKDSHLSRFKSVSYNCKPQYKNENGLVCLLIKQKEDAVRGNQKQITDVLHKTFNSDQSLAVIVDSMKSGENPDTTELVFYVEQRTNPANEEKVRVSSTLVCQHLNKQETQAQAGAFLSTLKTTTTIKQQLEQIHVINLYPLLGLSEDQIKKYLDTPPIGFNPLLWDTAKKLNPAPKKLIPVQITGFQEISKRFKLQDKENKLQKDTLCAINQNIEGLNSRNDLIKTKIEQMKSHNEDLEQRILKVIINYEIRRKIGIPVQDAEKYLINILDQFQIELNSPINKEIQCQKFNEFTERIQGIENSIKVKGKHQLEQQAAKQLNDMTNLGDVQKSLKEQQKAFKSLIEIIKGDLKNLNLMKTNF